jgi:hypothetical protein
MEYSTIGSVTSIGLAWLSKVRLHRAFSMALRIQGAGHSNGHLFILIMAVGYAQDGFQVQTKSQMK